MPGGLQGKRIALVATEDATAAGTWRDALARAGATVDRLGAGMSADAPGPHASGDYAAVVLVGGGSGEAADRPRARFAREVVQLVRELAATDKPVVALGSAVGVLAEADVARGRHVSAPAAEREALESAGAHLAGEPLVCDDRLWTGRAGEGDVATVVEALASAVSQYVMDRNSEASFPASDPPPPPTIP